jgi:hypothetical protein
MDPRCHSLAQITKVSAVSATGVLLPYMLIFAGKTAKVVPVEVHDEPAGIAYTHTPSHFANAETTLYYMKRILVPFIENQRSARIASKSSTAERETNRWAILVWDNFSAHLDDSVIQYLTENRIKSLPLPPRCTSKYQPLDVLVNGAEKRYLTQHFSEWYFQALSAAAKQDPPQFEVLPTSSASKRKFIATMIAGVHRSMAGRSVFLRQAWLKSTLLDGLHQASFDDDQLDESTDIPIQNDLITEMLNITISEESRDVDASIELSEITQSQDAPDMASHFNIMSLLNDLDDDMAEITPEHPAVAEETDEDSTSDFALDYSSLSAPDDASYVSRLNNPSEVSCGLINFRRPTTGGAIEVIFERGRVLSPPELVSLMKSKNSRWSNLSFDTVSNWGENSYVMKVKHVKHGSIATEMPSLSYMTVDIPQLPLSEL